MTHPELLREFEARVRELEQIVMLQRELIRETDEWLALHATRPQRFARQEARHVA